jgi:hypothetical protein
MRMKMTLIALGLAAAVHGQNSPVTIAVDADANRHPIDPNIYGVAFASAADLAALNCPLNREGGNAETRYNWQANASNRAADWYFESIGETSSTPGEHADTFISDTRSSGAQAMITVPIIGYVARLGPNRGKLASYSVAKYGPQQSTDYWMPDAGNGTRGDGSPVTNNDPNDANMMVDSTFQLAWVQHLVAQWGTSASGGLRYYILDNEHSIWQSTHRDVHPTGATMDEVLSKMIDHAQRIKSVDPAAVVVGPEEWGWSGYFYSGYDQQWGAAHGWSGYPDRAAHSNADYLPWLLDQFHAYESVHGTRLLDLFTVHFYPQSGEFGDDTSTAMQQLRNRSTRALWDPNYVDASWISDKVDLIPRLHSWVNAQYPGTKIGITEYNWGAESHINGATTQADILGIFGRESLDLATRWTSPEVTTPTFKAIQMYRNYDGAKSTFGDTSVSASGPNPDDVSTFAAVRSADHALTIMIVSKTLTGTTPSTVSLRNFAASPSAQVWQLTAANTIAHLPDTAVSNGFVSLTLPPQSITLLVIPTATTTDTTAPSITLSGPPTLTNSLFTFTGTAFDNIGVTSVTFTLTGATTGSGTATGTTSWSASTHLKPGVTQITFTASDAAGNRASSSTSVTVAPVKRRVG